jgi:hypothetical protein
MFPSTPLSLLVLFLAVLVGCYFEFDPLGYRADIQSLGQNLPGLNNLNLLLREIVVNLVLALAVWVLYSLSQRYVLRVLLHYHGWMFENPRKPSVITKIWALLIKVLSGPFKPLLYSFQRSLPNLPLPSLGNTLSRYLQSVQPLMDEEKFERIKSLAYDFQQGIGRKLQRYLFLKYLWSSNYVSDWWEQYVYLRSRSSIMINSNYYSLVSGLVHCGHVSIRF